VVLLPDSGRNYIGKLYNDDWLRTAGLISPDEQVAAYDWRKSALGSTKPRDRPT